MGAQSLVRTEDEHSLADNFENSTQVRRLSEPARPCQVRAAQEDEQTLDYERRLRAGEVEGLDCDGEACGSEPCDAADKGCKQERKKQPGYNKKHVRNINDIIDKDQKTVKESKKNQPTKEHVEKKRKQMLKKQVGDGGATQDDATAALSNNVVATDHVAGNKEDTPPVETDIELEQQRMMNRVFNCPNLYSAAGPFTTVVQMVPVMVPNHQTGGYFVVHMPVQPLPEHVAQPQHVFHPQPSDSPFSSSSSSSSTCSSVSPPASDDGFVDGSDLESETGSLVEMVDAIKLVDDIK